VIGTIRYFVRIERIAQIDYDGRDVITSGRFGYLAAFDPNTGERSDGVMHQGPKCLRTQSFSGETTKRRNKSICVPTTGAWDANLETR
jgi:hypothetical protein